MPDYLGLYVLWLYFLTFALSYLLEIAKSLVS